MILRSNLAANYYLRWVTGHGLWGRHTLKLCVPYDSLPCQAFGLWLEGLGNLVILDHSFCPFFLCVFWKWDEKYCG